MPPRPIQHAPATYFAKRKSGLSLIGDLAWGSHFCQFYQTPEDLLEILVPYLGAGLESNELGLWVTDGNLDVAAAHEALREAVPRFEEYARKGQIEIISRDQWHAADGELSSAMVSSLDKAIARGFDGLRLVCQAGGPELDGQAPSSAAEAVFRYNVIAAFAYPRDQFDAVGLMAVVKSHGLAIVKNAGRWEVIESSEAQSLHGALRQSDAMLHSVFANMSEGFAYHRIVLDAQGVPCDYVFLEVNEAFERLTGLKREELLGRRVTQALPGIEKDPADWIGTYGRVALSGNPVQFENYSQLLRRWYSVSAFSPHRGFFAVTCTDITERKATEQALREANERLQNQAEELQTQAEELHAQAEELQASNEELRRQELALRESEERFRATYEHAAIGIEILSLDGRLLRGNGTLCRILGYSPQDLQQHRFSDITHPDDLPREMLLLDDLLAGRIPSYTIEKRYLHRKGHSVWVRVTSSLAQVAEPYRISIIEDITERKHAEAALRDSEERYRRFFDEDLTGDFLALPNGKVLECNPAFAEIYGFGELAAASRCDLSRFNPEDWANLMARLQVEHKVPAHQCVHRRPDGREIQVVANVVGRFQETGELIEVKGYIFDDTERKRAEGRLHRLNRTLRALNNSSQALMHATDETAYLQEVCRIIVEDCGHAMVWIGYAQDDEAQSVRPVAHAGFEEGYLETLGVTWADTERGRGPTGAAIRTGRPSLCRNMLTDPAFAPWREEAIRRGYASSIGLPLLAEGGAFGAVTIYSREPDPFSADEMKLLTELAEDLAYGITSLRLRAAHAGAEAALRESEARLRLAQEAANAGTWEWDLPTGRNFWSEEVWRLYGLEPHSCEPSYEAWRQTVHPEDRSKVEQCVQEAARRQAELSLEWRVGGLQSQERWLMSRGQPVRNAQGQLASYRGIVLDITDRKRAEEALRTSERRAKLLSDITARLLAAHDPQGVIEDLCQAVMEYLRCECFFNFLADPARGRLRLNACAGIPEHERRNLEWLDYGTAVCGCVARDGRRIVAEHIPTTPDEGTELVKSYGIKAYACHPILAGTEVLGTLSFGTKTREVFQENELSLMKTVTDLVAIAVQRQRSASALRASEQRLRLALEGGRMGRWEWDVSRDTSLWDPRVYELLGLDRDVPAASRILFSMIDKRDRDIVQRLVETPPAGGGDFHVEFRIHRHSGETAWLALRGRVSYDERGQAARLMGVMNDITQRKQMEADLRRLNDQLEEEVQAQTEELKDTVDRLQDEVDRRVLVEETLRRRSQMLEAFFQHTITPLAFLDKDCNFVRVNAAYAQADARDPEYFLGRNHFELYPHDGNRAIFEEVVRTKRPYFARAKPFMYPNAPQRVTYWDWQLTPLLDEHGEVQFLVLNLQDVTRQQTAFRELEQRARQLQKLTLELSQTEDRERKRLAEILHDDLQQLLAAAKFHLSLLGSRLKAHPVGREAVGPIDQILQEAIEKSRSLSHELSPAILYQGDLGETLEWLARRLQTKHGLTVHVETRNRVAVSSEPLKVFLYRTAQEILFNVVKHARVREARLRLQRLRGCVWLTISDQGQGFDPRDLGKAEGFGLLGIRERIELLGGRMRIRSVPGRGSTFLVVVPDGPPPQDTRHRTEDTRPRAEVGAVPHGPSSVPRRASSVLRVLLVDDHKVVREGLASLLHEQADLEVVGQAGNGREAVDLTHTLRPDVVVMDAAMPLMAGEEATRQIKLHLPDVRVVALSMFEEADMAEAMCRAGAEAYLLKTAPSHELLAAIRGRPSKGHSV